MGSHKIHNGHNGSQHHRISLEPQFPIRMDIPKRILLEVESWELGSHKPSKRCCNGQLEAKPNYGMLSKRNIEEGEVDSNWGDQQVVTGKMASELSLKEAFP